MKKLTAKQQDIVRKMQDGRQLIRHKQWCGDPAYYTLVLPSDRANGGYEFVNKNSVEGLHKRELIELAENDRRSSTWRLTETGRKVVTV